MQPAVGAAAWAPGPWWPTHTGGALSSEKPPSTQVNLSVSLPVYLSFVSFFSFILQFIFQNFIILLLQPFLHHTFLFLFFSGVLPPLHFLHYVICLSGTCCSSLAHLSFAILSYSRSSLQQSNLALSIMASNYLEARSF